VTWREVTEANPGDVRSDDISACLIFRNAEPAVVLKMRHDR
jgi:hypothetical protein